MPRRRFIENFAKLVLLGLLMWVSALQLIPPSAIPKNQDSNFSAYQASDHLRVIGQHPRIPGSAYHKMSYHYLQDELQRYGLDSTLQQTTIVDGDLRSVPFQSASITNVVGRLPGTNSSGAVLFVAHYDSVQTGPGVGDTAMGVVALLEMARLIAAEGPLRNDLIILFTDGHEYGLLGAQAFVREHPFFDEVKMVFNFEGQGPNGPVFMFETSANNGWLVQQLAKAVNYPFASSVSQDVYHFLSFDNDFRVITDAGVNGLGFSIVSDMAYYHSAKDSLARLDLGSLQHHGEYALGLARHFGQISLDQQATTDAVYFTVARQFLLHYSKNFVMPISLVLVFLFVVLIWIGVTRSYVKWPQILRGCGVALTCVFLSLGILWLVQTVLQLNQDTYESSNYFVVFMGLSGGVTMSLYTLATKGLGYYGKTMGSLIVLSVVLLLISGFMPGASYILAWPLLSILIGVGVLFFSETKQESWYEEWVKWVSILPALLICMPVIWMLFLAMTLAQPLLGALLWVLLLTLVMPLFIWEKWDGRILPTVCIVASLAVLIMLTSQGHSGNHPKRTSLFYLLDATTNQAVWATLDRKVDGTMKDLFLESVQDKLVALSPFGAIYTSAKAEVVPYLQAPELVVVSDEISAAGVRSLVLKASSLRQAPTLTVYLLNNVSLLASSVNGYKITNQFEADWYWGLRFHGLPTDGIELAFHYYPTDDLHLIVLDQSHGWPLVSNVTVRPRPIDRMSNPGARYHTDSTFVSKEYTF